MIQNRFNRLLVVAIAGAIGVALLTLSWVRSQAQGGDLPYGQAFSGSLKAGTTDTWHFVGNVGDVIAIAVERKSGDLDPVLTLQDPAQQLVAGTQAIHGEGKTALAKVRLAQRGSYLIGVGGADSTSGSYSLTLTLVTASPQTPTPQATLAVEASAGALEPGTAVQGELDSKIYRQSWHFHGSFGDVLDITMKRLSGDLDPGLTLVAPTNDTVAANNSLNGGPDAGILGFQLPFTGEYTLIARREGPNLGQSGTTSGKYELVLSRRSGDTATNNTPLTPGTTIQGRLNEAAPSALYRLDQGGAVAISLDLSSLHRLASIRVLNTTGTVLFSKQGISPLTVSARLPDKGPFLVEATSVAYESQPFTDFGLTVYRLSANIAQSPNDAHSIPYGEDRLATANGADHWFFIGHSGDIVALKVTPRALAAAMTVRVSGPQDVLLYQGDLGAGLEQTLTLGDTGLFEIEAQPADDKTPVPYELALNRIGANGSPFDFYRLATNQGPLTLGTPISGKLAARASEGWWLDATAGQVANLKLTATSSDSSLGLALQRPDGSLVDVQVTKETKNAVIRQVLLEQTGRYRVVIFDSLGQSGGQYTLLYEDATGGTLQTGQPIKGIIVPTNGYSTWTLDVVAGSLINLRLSSLATRSWSPALFIADPYGQVIASGSSGPDASIDLLGVTAPVTGTYHIVVGGQVTTSFASFNLLANVQPPFGAEARNSIQVSTTNVPVLRYAPVPTNRPVQVQVADLISPSINIQNSPATAISFGSTLRGEILRGTFSQIWQFGGLLNQIVAASATTLGGTVGPDLILIDAAGNIVHEQLHVNDPTTVLTYRMPQGGNYRLIVRMGLNGGRYLLSLNTIPVTFGGLRVSAGTPIVIGQTLPGELLSDSVADSYYFLGTANDVISINAARSSGDLALALQLLSPKGVNVAADTNKTSDTKATIAGFRLPDSGMYTIVVQHTEAAAKASGSYFLYLGIDKGFRLNNRGGGIITSGQTVTGLLALPDNEDTWLFQGHSGERVTFIASGTGDPAPSPLGLRLQDTTGQTFAAQDVALTQGAVRLSDVMLPYDGIYRIQVTGATETSGIYALTWQPEQERLVAGPLRYNQSVGGVFTAQHNADSWVFTGTQGDVISIALEYERGDKFNGAFQLRSENGLTLAQEADVSNGLGARIENVLLPFSGSYTLFVGNPAPTYKGTGVYSLSVDLRDSKARSMGSILHYGQQGQGELFVDDAVDTWVFAARAGDVVKIAAQAQDQYLNLSLDLRNSAGILLASIQSDSTNKSGSARVNDFKITANGVYVVTVGGGPQKTTGSYLLSLDNTPPPLAETATLNYDDIKEGLIADDRASQVYIFTGRQGDTVSAKAVSEAGSTLAATLAIQDSDNQLLVQVDSNGTDGAVIPNFKLPRTGLYTLVVSRYLGAQGHTIGRFTVNLKGTPEDHPIKGNVEYGKQAIGRLNAETPVERINFNGKAGDVVGIVSRATSGDLDTQLSLEDPTGAVLASNDDTDGPNANIVEALLPADNTYTIVISSNGKKDVVSSGNYELFVNRLYQVNPANPPQVLMAYGQRMVGSVDANDAEVRYTFSGNRGDSIAVQLVHQTDDSPPVLTIEDPVNTVLAQGKLAIGQTTIDGYTLPVDGLYTIVIKRPVDAKATYSPFAMTLSLLTAPGGRTTSGGVLGLKDSVTGGFAPGQAAQYWLFQAKARQSITINLLQLNGNLLPALVLIGPNGQGLASLATSEHDQSISLNQIVLPSDGVYSLLILPGGANRIGQYRLTMQPDSNPTATPITLIPGQIVSGTLNAIDQEQRWTVSGQQGESVAVRMLATGGTLVPQLHLVAANGHVLAESYLERTQNAASAVLVAILPTSGDFTLIAGQPYSLTPTAGTYNLSLDTGTLSPQAVIATQIAYSQPVSKAAQQGTTDFWIFAGSAGDTVSISAVSAEKSKAPGIALQDSSGHVLVQATPSADTPDTNIGAFTLPSDGRYVIALQSSTTTTYMLLVQRRQDIFVTGNKLRSLVLTKPLDSAISTNALLDYWSFDATAGSVVQIDGGRLDGNLRLDIALYSPTSAYLASAIATAADGKLTMGPLRLPEDGKYIVVVTRWRGATGKTSGRYSLTLSNPPGASGSDGGVIAGYGQKVTGGITPSDSNDVWTFSGQAGDVIDVRMTRLDSILIPAFKLTEMATGKEIGSAKADKNEALLSHVILPSSGSFSVTTSGATATSGGYQLSVERVQSALQANMSHAEGIAYGETRSGELTKDISARSWVFFARSGERITVEAAPSDGSKLDPYLYLIGPDGTTIAADDNGGGGTKALIASHLLNADGFYGIVVSGSPLQQAEQRLGGFNVALKRNQPGATYQGDVSPGVSADGTLTSDQPIQEWTFRAANSKTIAASMNSSSVTFNSTISIVAQDGKLLGSSAPAQNGKASVEVKLPGAGIYAVLVSANTNGAQGHYQLQVSYALAPGGGGALIKGQPVSGTVNDADFTDAWHVDLAANSKITLNLTRTSGDLDLDLALYGPDGIPIPVPKIDSAAISVDGLGISVGGSYTLIVSRAGGASGLTSGDYHLQIDTTN
ncbi:MAG: PPC domain-containing protein [Chloroflexota bacterium]